MKDILHIYCDGACLPVNPGGVATWAFIVKRDGATVCQQHGVEMEGDGATNNVAEYAAVFHALRWCISTTDLHRQLFLYSDSKLVINQLIGKYRIYSPVLQEWARQCRPLIDGLNRVEFRWIPREENADADALTLQAYQEHQHATNL